MSGKSLTGVAIVGVLGPGLALALALALALSRAWAGPDRSEPDPAHGLAVVVGTHTRGPEGGCFQCHGIDGAGDAVAAFPRLADQVYGYLYDSLKDYASGARASDVMEPIARALTDEQMRDVSAYYASVEGVPYPPPPEADPELLRTGAALAAAGAPARGISPCANCHGMRGVGMPPAFPFLAGQYADYMEHQLLLWRQGRRSGDPAGIMAHIAEDLTLEQIRAVSLYFASLRPPSVTPDEMAGAGSGPSRALARGARRPPDRR